MALRAAIFAMAASGAAAQTCEIVTLGSGVTNGRWNNYNAFNPLNDCPTSDLATCEFENCAGFTGPLYLGQADFTSTSIPASIGSLSGVTNLHLWDNQLTGSIPDTVDGLTSAKGIFMDQNDLTGTIPSTFGALTGLTWLALHYNHLTGTIPAEITQATSLKQLYLDNNELTGSIPDDIGNLSDLQRLAIWGQEENAATGASENDLQGSLPRSFGSLTNLEYFTISKNDKMSGYPLLKEHCELIANRQVACSMTDIQFTACDSECADYIQEEHGDLNFPSTDGGCGAVCETICDYGDWEWQCTNPDVATCYNTYNPCKNLHCEKVEEVNAPSWTADRDYELVVVKSGTNYPQENIVSGQTLTHYSGNDISHVIKCVEVECFETVCVDDA